MMNDEKISFASIGRIRSPHKELSKIPIQPVFCDGIEGTVVLDAPYVDDLKNLEGFSHIHLFYYFNQSQKTCLRVKPYLSDEEHGIFATRAPHRPNKLGMSLVRLLRVEDNILTVEALAEPLRTARPPSLPFRKPTVLG